MPIYAVGGMLMDVAPELSESIAVWMYNGFNTRIAVWKFELERRGIKLNLIHTTRPFNTENYKNFDRFGDIQPQRLGCDSLWEISDGKYKK